MLAAHHEQALEPSTSKLTREEKRSSVPGIEMQPRNQIYLSVPQPMPSMNRRHSANPRPLRSSPLAGPALSSDGCEDDSDESSHGKPKPSRISSSPELASPRIPSPSLFRRPGSSQGIIPEAAPPLPPLPEILPSLPQTPSKRSSIISLGRSKSKPKLNKQPSIEAPSVPLPPIPAWALQAASAGPSLTMPAPTAPGTRRPKSLHSLPQAAREVPPSIPRALSRDPAENWMTTNSYDTTPRFSRLGLGASGVVMPVSARTMNKRLSRVGSTPSMKSASSAPRGIPDIGTMPRVRPHSFIGTFAQFVSKESGSASEDAPSIGDARSSSSSSTTSSGSGSSKESAVTPTSTAGVAPPGIASTSEVHLAAADSFIKRMKSINLRPSRSRINVSTDAKSHRGFLSSFRPDGANGHDEIVPPLPVPPAAAQTRGRRVNREEVEEVNPKPGRRGTVRRLMRTLSTIGRKRSSP